MAGLFPPKNDEIWNEELNWQPIPVHVIPSSDDYMLQGTRQCSRISYDLANYLTDGDRYKQFIENNQPLLEFVKEQSGFDPMTYVNVFNFQQDLFVEQLRGFEYVNSPNVI